MRTCTDFLRVGGLKFNLILGGFGGSLLALLVGVNLTLIGLFTVILTGDFRDWYVPSSVGRAFPTLHYDLSFVAYFNV